MTEMCRLQPAFTHSEIRTHHPIVVQVPRRRCNFPRPNRRHHFFWMLSR